MSDNNKSPASTRRTALRAGLALAALPVLGLSARRAQAQAQERKVTKVLDFETTADVAKAEQEGEVVFYTHDGESAAAAVVDAFTKAFPKIKGSYVRAQNGALYGKLLAERSAGRFSVDVVQFSEIGTAIDFQKRGGYERHVSPQSSAFDAKYLSPTPGDYFWAGVTFGGIAYNTNLVKPEDAPKSWKDLLDPRWRNAMSTKQATSGMQFVEWYELRRLYGPEYWTAFAKQRPRGFDSRVPMFDRLAKGDDKVCAIAEYAGYLLYHEKGAPIAFVIPEDGMPTTPVVAGCVSKAPHPEASRLMIDWLMSTHGQTLYQTNLQIAYNSMRKDAPPMPDGKRLSDFKLLVPQDMDAYLASHDVFNKEWNAMMGL
jgi:iron(III) transport system substrate-binding protein